MSIPAGSCVPSAGRPEGPASLPPADAAGSLTLTGIVLGAAQATAIELLATRDLFGKHVLAEQGSDIMLFPQQNNTQAIVKCHLSRRPRCTG